MKETDSIGATQVATPSSIQAGSSLTASQQRSLLSAADTGAIYRKTWSQQIRGLFYYNWLEKHSGEFYHDGTRVWSTDSYRGSTGYHNCDQGYGVGHSIVVTGCNSYNGVTTGYDQEYDYFQVHVLAKGIPIYASHNMHVDLHPNGDVVSY